MALYGNNFAPAVFIKFVLKLPIVLGSFQQRGNFDNVQRNSKIPSTVNNFSLYRYPVSGYSQLTCQRLYAIYGYQYSSGVSKLYRYPVSVYSQLTCQRVYVIYGHQNSPVV